MVFNSLIVLSVAHVSAEAWQQMACVRLQERLTAHQLLDLICCFPLQQLGRFAICLWTFLCLPPPDSFYSYSYSSTSSSSSSSSSSSDDDDDDDDAEVVRVHNHLEEDDVSSSPCSPSSPVHIDNYYYHSHFD